MRRRSFASAALASVVVMAVGCSPGADDPDNPGETPEPVALQPVTSPPADDVSVVPGDDPGELALGVSRALYDEAPVVVLAASDDPDQQGQAQERAVELGVPLLLTPPTATPQPTPEPTGTPQTAQPELREELTRLATTTVLAYGPGAAEWAAQLDQIEVRDDGTSPQTSPAPPLSSLAVLAPEAEHAGAATATARATGARILETTADDPRADPELISALADDPPTETLALGSGFGDVERLRGRLAVAATGVELPGGGQVVYPGRRLIALYGHPGNTTLGALGEQSLTKTITRAKKQAAEYDDLVDEPVVPAFEIITTIASASAGPEGDYSRRTPVSELRPWIDAAAEAGVYVVLDLQPGHTDFLTQAKEYEELLREPHVGLALDPEWRLAPDERHLENIGSVKASEVNKVVDWFADLTAEHRLPQKLLIVHQFQLRMIQDRGDIDTSRDQVAVLLHADGFGTPSEKLATWRALHADPLPGAWWGWKNFYDEDRPTFTPKETVAVEPSPVFISYQ